MSIMKQLTKVCKLEIEFETGVISNNNKKCYLAKFEK